MAKKTFTAEKLLESRETSGSIGNSFKPYWKQKYRSNVGKKV